MYVKKIKNRSGSVSVIVASKHKGRYEKLTTIGISKDKSEIEQLEQKGLDWIHRRKLSIQPELDLFGEERRALEHEREMTERVLSNIDNILLNGTELILDRVFDRIGFNRIEDKGVPPDVARVLKISPRPRPTSTPPKRARIKVAEGSGIMGLSAMAISGA